MVVVVVVVVGVGCVGERYDNKTVSKTGSIIIWRSEELARCKVGRVSR